MAIDGQQMNAGWRFLCSGVAGAISFAVLVSALPAGAGDVLGSDGSVPSAEELTTLLKPKEPAIQTRSLGGTRLNFRGVTVIEDGEPAPDGGGDPTVVEAPPSIDLSVNFAFNSAELTEHAKRLLDNLGKALTSDDLAEFAFKIEGHTDAVGSDSYNERLSRERANAVKAYLQARFGISAARLESLGLGERRLLYPDRPDDGANRRVQITNLGAY